MTHEPECPATRLMVGLRGDPDRCPFCDNLRAAYQRGRRDEFDAYANTPGDPVAAIQRVRELCEERYSKGQLLAPQHVLRALEGSHE